MKKQKDSEDIDRELVLNNSVLNLKNGRTYDRPIKICVSKKALSLSGSLNDKSKLRFQKNRRLGREYLDIFLDKHTVVSQTCSLGHTHETSAKTNVYGFFQIDYEQVEALVEWLKEGNWTEVSRTEPKWRKVLRECHELLGMIEAESKLLKPACQKLKSKIKSEFFVGYQEKDWPAL